MQASVGGYWIFSFLIRNFCGVIYFTNINIKELQNFVYSLSFHLTVVVTDFMQYLAWTSQFDVEGKRSTKAASNGICRLVMVIIAMLQIWGNFLPKWNLLSGEGLWHEHNRRMIKSLKPKLPSVRQSVKNFTF